MKYDPILGSSWELMEASAPALDSKRRNVGEVQFASSSSTDAYIQRAIQLIAAHLNVSVDEVMGRAAVKVAETHNYAKKSPILGGTIASNAWETSVFSLLWENKVQVPGAPKFSEPMFFRLSRRLAGERSDFFPLVSWVDRRRLSANPHVEFTRLDADGKAPHGITTAAATPTGHFYYNVEFMQSLINWAHLKGLKGNGDKYASQGGPIPDEYAYIEFVIMHECMHYTNDDFYYQNIIPNAKAKIINYVGDFRTNYTLVKSGFAQLPLGLFSDNINLDRQQTYKQMYDLVAEELNKIREDGDDGGDEFMDSNSSDSHDAGQKEGGSSQGKQKSEGASEQDIDKNQRRVEEDVDKKTDVNNSNTGKPTPDSTPTNPGKGRSDVSELTKYKEVKPTYDWRQLLRKMFASSSKMIDVNWNKIARRSITGLDVARARGAGAIKPAEVSLDTVQIKIAIVFDTSGSMHGAVAKVMSNVCALLRQPMFKKNNIVLIKFSDGHDAHVVNVALNKSGPFNPNRIGGSQQWTGTYDDALDKMKSGGTDITSAAPTIEKLLNDGFNVLICSDTDMTYEPNKSIMVKMMIKHTARLFWVLPSLEIYKHWRETGAFVTDNVTCL